MCLRVIILFVFSVVYSHLDAIEMQVVDGACTCYESTGRQSPIKEVERSWNRLKQDSTVHTTKRGIPDEDLYEYRKEYKIVADEAYKRCVPLVNTIKNLKTAKNSYYYPSDFERLFEALYRFNDFR